MKEKDQEDQKLNQQSEEQLVEETLPNESETQELKLEAEVADLKDKYLSLIHISEPTRPY